MKFNPKSSDIISIIALIVACASLYLSHTLHREDQKPILKVGYHYNKTTPDNIWIRNGGIGPAVIHDFAIMMGDKRLYDERTGGWSSFFKKIDCSIRNSISKGLIKVDSSFFDLSPTFEYKAPRNKWSLPPGEKRTVFEFNSVDYGCVARRFTHAFDFIFCYCSVFDDQCKVLSYRRGEEPIDSCEEWDPELKR